MTGTTRAVPGVTMTGTTRAVPGVTSGCTRSDYDRDD